jgi:hypothetical protein
MERDGAVLIEVPIGPGLEFAHRYTQSQAVAAAYRGFLQEEGPALPGVGGPAPGGQVEKGEGPGKPYLVEDPGEAVAHAPEAPGGVDLHHEAAEGVAQDLAPDFPVDLGFPFRKEGGGGGHPLFSQTCYRSR